MTNFDKLLKQAGVPETSWHAAKNSILEAKEQAKKVSKYKWLAFLVVPFSIKRAK